MLRLWRDSKTDMSRSLLGASHGGCETQDSANIVCTWRLFFDLEWTLADYREHPHLSSYPFQCLVSWERAHPSLRPRPSPCSAVLVSSVCFSHSPWSFSPNDKLLHLSTDHFFNLSLTGGLVILESPHVASVWETISTDPRFSRGSHSVVRTAS